jgi:hypothetical protein
MVFWYFCCGPHVAGLAALMISHHNLNNNYPNNLYDGDIQHMIAKYATDVLSDGNNKVGRGLINATETMKHIDKAHGYYVYHSSQIGSSAIGSIGNLGNHAVFLSARDCIYPPGAYVATLFSNTYTHVIPLPSFSVNPQIIDTWVTHKGGVSNNTNISGLYSATINATISGNNINAIYLTHIWKIIKNSNNQNINHVWYPNPTNELDPNFSMLIYDPGMVTNSNDITGSSNNFLSVYS